MRSKFAGVVATLVPLILGVVEPSPISGFAFNSQLPPVAYYEQGYQYQFSADTFKSSDGSALTYSSANLPSWLSLDSNTRLLSGTPPIVDNNASDTQVDFTLIASDDSGQTEVQCTLQISNSSAPTWSASTLQAALESSGNVSSGSSFVLKPNRPFEIKFPSDFFSETDRTVIGHYAVTQDHSPLPIWLDFDGSTNTFSGIAPVVNSDIAQAESYGVLFIDSTYQGFTSAAAPFELVLGANVLAMNISNDAVNATVGEPFSYEIPFGNITLNGEEIHPANLSSVKVSIPDYVQSWLSYYPSNASMIGTPPSTVANETISVNIDIVDTYNDTVSWNVEIAVSDLTSTTVFSTSSLPDANVTQGGFFVYPLENFILNKEADISMDSTTSFLTYHSDNYTIVGEIPDDFNITTVYLTATLHGNEKRDAEESTGKATSASAHFTLYGVKNTATSSRTTSSSASKTVSSSHSSSRSMTSTSFTSSHSTSASATSTGSESSLATATTSGVYSASKKKNNNNSVAIGCGVGIPVGLVAIAAVILLIWWLRRRRRRGDNNNNSPGNPDGPTSPNDISWPRPTSMGLVMAPVFRSADSDNEGDFDVTDDGETSFGTPEKKQPWDSPQRASAMNFLQMDGLSSSDQLIDDKQSMKPDVPAFPNKQATQENEEIGNIPRESWRRTNTGERRWQDARVSYNSIASIAPTEPPTIQPAQTAFPSTNQGPRQAQNMIRDPSSGILHRVGSHASSAYTEVTTRDQSFPQFRQPAVSMSSNRLSAGSDTYQTASSGDDGNSVSDDALDLRPYRDDQGEVRWTGEHAREVVRKPSQVTHQKAGSGHQGELAFV